MSKDERTLFGTDGVRGLANRHPMTAELAMKLAQKEHAAEEIEAALDHLESRGWVDDRRTAYELARYLVRSRGYGPAKVRARLTQQHRLPGGLVDEALSALVAEEELDWARRASELLGTRRADPDDPRTFPRLVRFLVGRGFNPGLARSLVAQHLDALRES